MKIIVQHQTTEMSLMDISDRVFGATLNMPLVHQVVNSFIARGHTGTKKQKSRAEVSGGNSKPWPQKGTGRARAGMSSSPLWRGGGRIFPNSPEENFSQKVNKKMYRAGMRSILSQLAREGRLNVVDQFNLDAPKTKELADKVKAMGLDSVLIIVDQVSENLYLASRNLHKVAVCEPQHADPLALFQYKKSSFLFDFPMRYLTKRYNSS